LTRHFLLTERARISRLRPKQLSDAALKVPIPEFAFPGKKSKKKK
jgi:hypothetical protein